MADREAWNRLRVDLYRRLLPRIQREDQESGAFGFTVHWDDPDMEWDSAENPDAAVQFVWDAVGLAPLYQELFFALESAEGEDLAVLESLDALVDPLRCPEALLGDIAASFGYRLEEGLSEAKKRAVVLGLQQAFKAIGQFVGFKVWYRMIGLEVINVVPLWKKDIEEANDDYSQVRYDTTPVAAQPVGPAGTQFFTGQFSDAPIKPGTVRFTDGTVVVRSDVNNNDLIGPNGESGTMDHVTGEFTLNLVAPAAGAVTAAYEKIDEEWPYHAARIDIELNLSPGGGPVPLVDPEVVDGIIERLDEVRPIHVLLRALSLTVELRDTFEPGATDQTACAQLLRDSREAIPSVPTSFGREDLFIADEGLRGEDSMRLDLLDGSGSLTDAIHVFEDRAEILCPLDLLIIDTGGAVPAADGYW